MSAGRRALLTFGLVVSVLFFFGVMGQSSIGYIFSDFGAVRQKSLKLKLFSRHTVVAYRTVRVYVKVTNVVWT